MLDHGDIAMKHSSYLHGVDSLREINCSGLEWRIPHSGLACAKKSFMV